MSVTQGITVERNVSGRCAADLALGRVKCLREIRMPTLYVVEQSIVALKKATLRGQQ